jgi:hypothetical protein
MSLATDLDGWATGVASAVGLSVTRDPDLIYPPCVFYSLPEITAVTLPAVTVNVPVWLVASGTGRQAADSLLANILTLLDAVTEKTAQYTTLTVAGVDYPAYQTTAHLHVTL